MNRPGRPRPLAVTFAAIAFVIPATTLAAVDARMLRQPDVSATEIAFVYAGDVWVVPKAGGVAARLSTPEGEEQFPRFSPDGKTIAFTADYGGNSDVYVIPVEGGVPERLTWHPDDDRVLDWYPDGGALLFASGRESGKARFRQFYRLPRTGGLPEKLPLPYGEFGALAPDGKTLAYVPRARDYRTWKRYRGGMTADVWIFDLERKTSLNATADDTNDGQPMWYGQDTLYFLSDRDPHKRYNIWKRDMKSGRISQVTEFRDFDVRFPAIGPTDLVFEAGGTLHRLSLPDETLHAVPVEVTTDLASRLPRVENVGSRVASLGLAPGAKRVVVEARGEVFSVPAEHGPVLNLTQSSGVAERHPAWSPDGSEIAYFSDRGGEYDLVVRPATGGDEQVLAALGKGYRYQPYWSPDGQKLAWAAHDMTVRVFDRKTGEVRQVDQGLYMTHGELAGFRPSWSPDSRWLAWSRGLETGVPAIFVHDTGAGKTRQVTSGFYADQAPVFDPEGKYLFFLTNRTFDMSFSDFDNTWIYDDSTTLAALPLRADVPSPLLPRNDVVEKKDAKKDGEGDEKDGGDEGQDKKKGKSDKAKDGKDGKAKDDEDDEDDGKPEPVEIEFDGLERRAVDLPPAAGNYGALFAVKGKLLYLKLGGGGGGEGATLAYYDLEEREEKTVLGDVNGFEPSLEGDKLLVAVGGKYAIIDVAEGAKAEKFVPTDRLTMVLDPPAEWRQIFHDVWRLERDYFYDPNMHGVDWDAMRERYGALLPFCVTRWDLHFLLGELIGELNASHAYRGGGDTDDAPPVEVGLLGVDWAVDSGRYRVARIVRGADWDTEARSPLDAPGVEVSEGDYILAVDGLPLDPARDPWAGLQALAGRTVELTVHSKPSFEGARKVVVETLTRDADYRLRNLAWIESNRRKVEEATGGRVGYVYVPSTGFDGHSEFFRMFQSQSRKAGLIVDERFNDGGFIPDRMVEMLDRPVTNYWAVRDGKDWRWPPTAHAGPKAMLINAWSGSGGDCFPYYFREAGLGPLIGTRTWGGLIGISGAPGLIDGGVATVPTFAFYDTTGEWAVENEGVTPDIEVVDDPAEMWDGGDPQLERAIEEVLRRIETDGWTDPPRPAYPDRS